jgi:hypothetical protein
MLYGARRDGEGPYRGERGDVTHFCNGDNSTATTGPVDVQLPACEATCERYKCPATTNRGSTQSACFDKIAALCKRALAAEPPIQRSLPLWR